MTTQKTPTEMDAETIRAMQRVWQTLDCWESGQVVKKAEVRCVVADQLERNVTPEIWAWFNGRSAARQNALLRAAFPKDCIA